MLQKGGVIIYIAIVLALGVGGLMFGSQFWNPVAPQQEQFNVRSEIPKAEKPQRNVYRDPKFNFQFEYPNEGYEVIYETEEEYSARTQTNHRKNFSGYVGYQPPKFLEGIMLKPKELKLTSQFDFVPLTLWIFDNPQKLDEKTWFRDFWYYPFIWGIFAEPQKGQIAPKDEITISGQLTKSAVISYQPGQPKFILLSKEDKMFLFKIVDQEGNIGNKTQESFRFRK